MAIGAGHGARTGRSPNAVEGRLFTSFRDPSGESGGAAILERARTRQIEPNYRVLYSFGAVQAWAAAVVRVGSLDIQTVGAALRSHEFETVLGRIRFDDKGDVIPAGFEWFVWTDGEFVSKDVGKSGAAMRSGKRPE